MEYGSAAVDYRLRCQIRKIKISKKQTLEAKVSGSFNGDQWSFDKHPITWFIIQNIGNIFLRKPQSMLERMIYGWKCRKWRMIILGSFNYPRNLIRQWKISFSKLWSDLIVKFPSSDITPETAQKDINM